MRVAPLTKLIFAFVLSTWAFPLNDLYGLGALLAIEILYILLLGVAKEIVTGFMGIAFGALFLFGIQLVFGDGVMAGVISGLKMISMTLPFITLVAGTSVQDLSAALVRQCRVSPEYAFLLTSILRFIPDFLAEGKAIRQAQACRGFSSNQNAIRFIQSFFAVVEPLVLGAVGRAETLAISLEMRGFGGGKGPMNRNLAFKTVDYLIIILMLVGSIMIFVHPEPIYC